VLPLDRSRLTVVLGCTVVTDNEAEFSRVEGLVCENWLAG